MNQLITSSDFFSRPVSVTYIGIDLHFFKTTPVFVKCYDAGHTTWNFPGALANMAVLANYDVSGQAGKPRYRPVAIHVVCSHPGVRQALLRASTCERGPDCFLRRVHGFPPMAVFCTLENCCWAFPCGPGVQLSTFECLAGAYNIRAYVWPCSEKHPMNARRSVFLSYWEDGATGEMIHATAYEVEVRVYHKSRPWTCLLVVGLGIHFLCKCNVHMLSGLMNA